MKDTERKNKVCRNCGNFKSYYFKGPLCFARAKHGFCKKQKTTVENTGRCELWCNDYRTRYISKQASLNRLATLLNDISGIRQILQEAQEEDGE